MEPFSSKTVGGLAHEMVIAVSVHVCLIMNHGTILLQNSRGLACDDHQLFLFVFLLFMNHGTIVQQNNRGSGHEMIVFRLCSSLCSIRCQHVMIITISVCVSLIHEPWNHCPQVIEGGTCDDRFFSSCWSCGWTMKPSLIAKSYG